MTTELNKLNETLLGMASLTTEQNALILEVLTQLERYFKTVFSGRTVEKRGSELSEPLDATLKMAILMLEAIDLGTTGLDDQVAKSLREIYEKYLGTFKI